MMRPGADEHEDCGPGWYEAGRELELGVQVREGPPGDTLLAEWTEAWRRPLPATAAARPE